MKNGTVINIEKKSNGTVERVVVAAPILIGEEKNIWVLCCKEIVKVKDYTFMM